MATRETGTTRMCITGYKKVGTNKFVIKFGCVAVEHLAETVVTKEEPEPCEKSTTKEELSPSNKRHHNLDAEEELPPSKKIHHLGFRVKEEEDSVFDLAISSDVAASPSPPPLSRQRSGKFCPPSKNAPKNDTRLNIITKLKKLKARNRKRQPLHVQGNVWV